MTRFSRPLNAVATAAFLLAVSACGSGGGPEAAAQIPPDTSSAAPNTPPPAVAIEPGPGTEYFVAPDGDDEASGASEDPFATISQCSDVVGAGDTCTVRSGIYRETVSVTASGTPEAPILFRADPGATVLISGAEVVEGFLPADGDRYRAGVDWDLGPGANQVFADGIMLWEARFPNSGATSGPDILNSMAGEVSDPQGGGADWNFSASGVPGGLDGAKINILPGPEWVAETAVVTSSDDGRISFSAPAGQLIEEPFFDPELYRLRDGNPYVVWGHPALLDSADEFYHDGSSITLAADPAGRIVEAKRREFAFVVDGQSYVTIQGFHVFAATITTGDPEYLEEPDSASSDHVTIIDVHLRYVSHFTQIGPEDSAPGEFSPWLAGMTDTGLTLYGTNHTVARSSVAYSAGNGIALAGSGHTVTDTIVRDVDYAIVDGAALQAGFYDFASSDHTVANNSFGSVARSVVTHRNTQGLLLLNNDLYGAGLVASDLGITYTYETDGAGTVIAGNRVHDNGSADSVGIYLDNGTSGVTIHHNTVWGVTTALQLNLPSPGNTVVNNTLIGDESALRAWGSDRSPEAIDVSGTSLINNIMVGERQIEVYPYDPPLDLGFDESNNLESVEPGFADPARFDFSLTPASPAIDGGAVVDGLTDGFGGEAPDIGAAEGELAPQAGASSPEPCAYGDPCAPAYG